eukprot:g6546.t1
MSSTFRLWSRLKTRRFAQTSRVRKSSTFALDRFSSRVRELLPVAVSRSLDRVEADEFQSVDPRAPRNQVVTKEDGQRYIVRNGGGLAPLYRDWEKEFGKPIGDPRPYYRKNMGPLLMRYEKNPELDSIKSLIVVEGLQDWTAVKRAINAPIFVCDGRSILDHVFTKYVKHTVSNFKGDVILLMDPDTAGRRMRTAVHSLMQPCQHAFVSEYDAVVGMGTIHESIGIEHCSPETIRTALKNTKTLVEKEDNDLKFDTLYEMGLVQTPAERTEGVRLRRRFFCGFLGIGFCDAKQLIKQLNQ